MLVNSDFVGKFELAKTQFNVSKIDVYIERYERYYLNLILGSELADLYLDNLTDPIYVKFDTIDFGIKSALLGFVYYEYIKDDVVKQVPIGSAKSKAENSILVNLTAQITNRFNESVHTVAEIQKYIQENLSDYPTFKGSEIKYEYFL